MGLMELFTRKGSALRTPERHEEASITTAVIHMPTPRLAGIADGNLRELVGDAMRDGGGILQMGLAPTDLEIDGDRFAARCDLRLTTPGSHLEIRVEGAIDPRGMVSPTAAALISCAPRAVA